MCHSDLVNLVIMCLSHAMYILYDVYYIVTRERGVQRLTESSTIYIGRLAVGG